MDLIASRAISCPLRTIDRNWSCSSCWVLVLAIVFASLLASAANFTKQRLACQAEALDLFCGGRGASAGAGGLRRAPGGGRLGRGALGGRGLGLGAPGSSAPGGGALRCRALARGGLGSGGLGGRGSGRYGLRCAGNDLGGRRSGPGLGGLGLGGPGLGGLGC